MVFVIRLKVMIRRQNNQWIDRYEMLRYCGNIGEIIMIWLTRTHRASLTAQFCCNAWMPSCEEVVFPASEVS